MASTKQTSGGLSAMLMGVVFICTGLGAGAWLVSSLSTPVIGARGGAFYVLFVMFCFALVPGGLVGGALSIYGGYQKRRAARSTRP